VASRGYGCFFFMLCFYMLFPLTSRQKCLYRYREGKKSLDLWRAVMILRMLEGVMVDTSVCVKVLPCGLLLVSGLKKDKEASKSM